MTIHKRDVARVLDEIGRYLQIEERNRFRSRAYINAAHTIDSLQVPIDEFVESGAIAGTKGIGKATRAVIEEIVRTGKSRYLEELRAKYPQGIFELLRVSGLGLRKIGLLYSELGIGDVDALEAAIQANKLLALRGFGSKTQQKIAESIQFYRTHQTRFLLPKAMRVAQTILDHVAALPGIDRVEVSGSIRRRLEVVGNINLCVVAKDLESAARAVESIDFLDRAVRLDETTVEAWTRTAMPVRFHLCKPGDFSATLFSTTGSKEFVEAVMTRAKKKVGSARLQKSEKEIFRAAGFPYVEPEMREAAPANRGKLPKRIVDVNDLRGTFHVHSIYSDGNATIPEMLQAAADREYAYVGLSDHSPSAYYAGGLTVERLAEQHAEIESHRVSFKGMRIFLGTESDILPNGDLDYPPETLAKFDFVIASVHSRFKMSPAEMTERMLRAVHNPFTTILGHLTGRLLLSREGYSLDFGTVFAAAAKRGVLIEVNGSPYRLDLDWRLMQRARKYGVRFVINPDAHSTAEMNYVVSGTWAARKGGLTPEDVFNTRPVEEVERYLKGRRENALKVSS